MKTPIATKLIPLIDSKSAESAAGWALTESHQRVSNWGTVQVTPDSKLHGEKASAFSGYEKYGKQSYPRFVWNILYYVDVTLYTGKITIKETGSNISVKVPHGWNVRVARAQEQGTTFDTLFFNKDGCEVEAFSLLQLKRLPDHLKESVKAQKAAQVKRLKELNFLMRKLNSIKFNERPLSVRALAEVFPDLEGGHTLSEYIGRTSWAKNAVIHNVTNLEYLRGLYKVGRIIIGEDKTESQKLAEILAYANKQLELTKSEFETLKSNRLALIPTPSTFGSALALN